MADLNTRDTKLVQFLNEAHAKEAELEADLIAHINLTEKAPYKKRLQKHLSETKNHKRRVASRIKALGGTAEEGVRAPGVPTAVGELAGKGLAAVKGQVGVARAAVTSQAETHLRNAREELREEYVEIGLYSAIETFATEVGDRETAQLAKAIRRDEQKTADYLERLIPQLVKDVVRSEIPRDQRATGRRRRTTRRRTSTARKRTTSTARKRTATPARKRTTTARKRTSATARKRTTTARKRTSATARKRTTSARKTTRTRGATNGGTRRTAAKRSTARKRAGGTRSRTTARS